MLRFSVKEGVGEAWSEHGSVGRPRLFVYWMEPDLQAVVKSAGGKTIQIARSAGPDGVRWLDVSATMTDHR